MTEKQLRIKQFNMRLKDLLEKIKPTSELAFVSKIDLIQNMIAKCIDTIEIINNFISYVVEDEIISDKLEKNDINFFIDYSKEDFIKKSGGYGKDIFDSIKKSLESAKDKKGIIKEFDFLRKVAKKYQQLKNS